MSIIAKNAEWVLKLIRDNGGSITGALLREKTDELDFEVSDLRNAIARLRLDKRIRAVGATRSIVYHLAGKESKVAPKPEPSRATEPKDQFELAEHMAEESLAQAAIGVGAGDVAGAGAPGMVYLHVPMVTDVPAEVQLIAALDFISQHFKSAVDGQALERAATWLASKHRAAA